MWSPFDHLAPAWAFKKTQSVAVIEVCAIRVDRTGFSTNIYSHSSPFIREYGEGWAAVISDTAFSLFSFLVLRKMGKEAPREVEKQIEVI